MPRIPQYVAQQPMPTSPGLPRGGVQIPVVQQPLLGDQGPSILERSLGGTGDLVQQVGQLGLHAAEIEQRRQHAQDVLDGTLGDQDWAQRFQEEEARLQQEGDYRTLPKDVLEVGNRLLEQVARDRNLSPQARALYQARVQERLTVAQQKALTLQGQRRDQDVVYAQSNLVHEALRTVSEATTPYERELALGRAGETIDAFQATHLANPQALADLKAKLVQGIRKNDALVAIRANPMEAYGELQGISQAYAKGEVPVITTEAFKGLTPGELAELTDDAWQHLREEGTYREHAQAAAERQRTKEQEATARTMFADLMALAPTAENLPAIQRQFARINAAGRSGTLSYGQHQALMSDAQAWLTAAKQPPTLKDDPEIDHLAALQLLVATTPEDFLTTQRFLTQHHNRLTPERLTYYGNELRKRQADLTVTQDESFKAGRQLILDSVVPEAAMLGMPGAAAMVKEEDRQRLSDALRAFEGALYPLTIPQRQAQWRAAAQDVITNFIGQRALAGDVKALPRFLWTPDSDPMMPTPVSRDEALQRIQQYTTDDALRGALLRRYDAVAPPQPQGPPPPPPSPPRRSGWWPFGGQQERRQ